MQSPLSTSRPNADDRILSPLEASHILLALGTSAGFVRVLGLSVIVFVRGEFIQHGLDLSWTAPLGAAIFVLTWGGLVWMAGAFFPRLRTPWAFVASVLWLPVTSLLFDINGFHGVSALLLGFGVAVVSARVVRRYPAFFISAARLASIAGTVMTILAVIGTTVFRSAVSLPPAPTGPTPPNVIVMVLDTVRAQSLGAYGNDAATSPALDRLAASGVRFSQAHAPAPWTTPSHAALMTGKWPSHLGIDWRHGLPKGHSTLAEAFRRAGYLTAGFTANLSNTGQSSGIARGFDHYEDHPTSLLNTVRGFALVERLLVSPSFQRLLGHRSELIRKRSREITNGFLSWLDRQPDRPFFVFLNLYDAHDPYEAPPEFEARFGVQPEMKRPRDFELEMWREVTAGPLLRAYEAAIASQDEEIGVLLEQLEARGKLRQTLVVLTSDHGEEFYEHRVMRHGNSLYKAAIHIPLIMSLPGRIPAGVVVDTPVSLRSIATTVVEMTIGPGFDSFPGPSLVDIMQGSPGEPLLISVDAVPNQPESFPVHFGPLFAVIEGRHKYIVDRRGKEELYALNDSTEQTNLVDHAEFAATADQFRKRLATLRSSP